MLVNKWRTLTKNLRTYYPLSVPVVVRRVKMKDCARTNFDGYQFKIRISTDQPDIGLIDSLLHEWAHCLAIEEAYQHDGRWSAIFGEIYEDWTHDFEREEE
jgi:hypothetical protein